MKLRCVLFVSFLTLTFAIRSQIIFESEDYMIDNHVLHSGVAMGFADVNGDALDDLILLDDTKELYVVYQTEGFASHQTHFVSVVSNSSNWSLQLADVDNNGLQDIFIGGRELTIFMAENMVPSFSRTTIPAAPFLTQGSNFADMDSDGDVDLFVCDDDAANFVALNDGAGNFTRDLDYMDFSTDPPSDGSGNYGTVWCDYDRDGDVDLYISKCRLGTNPGDPERTNQFFENTPDGFERMNDFPEILSNDQSWVADFIDVDNDGDWDLLLANHGGEPMNLFIQQDDGTFIDEAPQRGIDFVAGVIQLVSGDFDNDGDVDVFAAGTDHFLFVNDGTGHFSDGGFAEPSEQIESATTGDYNNDGKLDLYAGYAHIYNNPSTIPDKLFINNTVGGNYIKFSLRGVTSNLYAIGATIEIFHGDDHQIREVRSGESYGINKSNILHFGLGQVSHVDSIKVFWPTGMNETFYDFDVNTTFQITEGKSVLEVPINAIQANRNALCAGDSLILTGPVADEYLWSNGENSRVISATEQGLYTLKVRYADHWLTLPSFQVLTESIESPQVAVEGQLIKCLSEEVELSAADATFPILWNTNADSTSIHVTSAGDYFFTETRTCGEFNSDTIRVENILVMSPSVEHDTVMKNMPAEILSNDPSTLWTLDTVSQDIIHTGSIFNIGALIQDSLVYAATSRLSPADPEAVGEIAANIDQDGYHNTSLSGGMYFTVFEECTIESIDVRCRVAGPRTILILDSDENEIYRQLFNLQLGDNTLMLNATIVAGVQYQMTTDSDENLNNLGFRSPDLIRSTTRVSYPFSGRFLSILESTFGTGQYYYFYNWQVVGPDKLCYSYWQPAHAIVDRNVAIDETNQISEDVKIYPNPTKADFNVELNENHEFKFIKVFNTNDQLVRSININQRTTIRMDKFEKGIYALKFIQNDGLYVVKKIIVF